MRPECFQENALRALMGDKLEDNPQVISHRTGPRAGQLAFEFVGLETRMSGIGREQFQRESVVLGDSRIPLRDWLCRAEKRLGGQERAFQTRIFLRISVGDVARHRPALYSCRASRTA